MVDFSDIQVQDLGSDIPPRQDSQSSGSIGSDTKPPRNSKSDAPKQNKYRQGELAKALTRTYGSVGMMLFPFDSQCGSTILENSEEMANSLEQLAKENDAVKRVLEKMVATGAWTAVIGAHLPVVMSIANHHVLPLFAHDEDDENVEEMSE